ncbi:MAG: reverse transcriptase family protein [Clostridiales bacterium]|jgi:hypothetical protein|nr:reverse transcriptase family protein [Clostridiales bacterium]
MLVVFFNLIILVVGAIIFFLIVGAAMDKRAKRRADKKNYSRYPGDPQAESPNFGFAKAPEPRVRHAVFKPVPKTRKKRGSLTNKDAAMTAIKKRLDSPRIVAASPRSVVSEAEIRAVLDKHEGLFCAGVCDAQYAEHTVKKKNGGTRLICAPSAGLLSLQNSLLHIFIRFPVSEAASGFEKGCSILDNAARHRGAAHMLQTDIENFFPSVTKRMFIDTFCPNLYRATAEKFWAAVSYKGGLPIGGPCSPFIANRVLLPLDNRIAAICAYDKITYSRYADDLTFTSDSYITPGFLVSVENAVRDFGFKLNYGKTRFTASRFHITGINVHNKKSVGGGARAEFTPGARYKSKLRREIYNYLVKNDGSGGRIGGKLSYLAQIEPEAARAIREKYSRYDKRNFFKILGKADK